ncbi:MAG: galactose-1-phosphate uridylyltransferase, partial [Syntrophomonadaceae bacterium]|nr:galactose-1-phosphate uridylyltransferase [Syntrophomonadaceae bacterium]
MPELRRDVVRNIWVVSATEQALEPQYFPINRNGSYIHRTKVCPFCERNEALTPPEIAAFRKEG